MSLLLLALACHQAAQAPSSAVDPSVDLHAEQPASTAAASPIFEDSRIVAARDRMVETQLYARDIRDPRGLAAMRTVPRHRFMPEMPGDVGLKLEIADPEALGIYYMLDPDPCPGASMRVLIVGAGAVGQVYGRHLAKAGAEVSFLVKPKYAEAARPGFLMANLNRGGQVQHFDGFGVLTELDAVAEQSWDQLWLCISSPALKGDWLEPTIAAVGKATVVSFQPGLRDRQLLTPTVPPDQLTKGMIAFSSWHAPLPGGTAAQPHTAYWSPPLSPSLFEGAEAAHCASTLASGGLPAKVGAALAQTARGSAFLLPCVAAMECGEWRFSGLRERRWSSLAAEAGAQALAISCAHLEIPKGPAGAILSPLAVRLASRLAPVVAPFDIETFLGVHFRKVGMQTSQALDTWVAEGEERGLPTDKLRELRQCLTQARGQASV